MRFTNLAVQFLDGSALGRQLPFCLITGSGQGLQFFLKLFHAKKRGPNFLAADGQDAHSHGSNKDAANDGHKDRGVMRAQAE